MRHGEKIFADSGAWIATRAMFTAILQRSRTIGGRIGDRYSCYRIPNRINELIRWNWALLTRVDNIQDTASARANTYRVPEFI